MDLSAYVGCEVLVQFRPGFALLVPVVTPSGKLGPAMVGEANNQQPLALPFAIGKVVARKNEAGIERLMLQYENGVQKGQPFFVEINSDNVYSVCLKGDKPLVIVP